MNFPYYCSNISELNYRTVLSEKFNTNIYSLPAGCCIINGIYVFTDPFSLKQIYINKNKDSILDSFKINYVLTGFESERVKTDSAIIQLILNAINDN